MDKKPKVIRYAVVGLGYITQAAILPAFKHANNSRLTTLISGDPTKLKILAKKYGAAHCYSYDDYDAFLRSEAADAIFIALPNNMHKDFATRAAGAQTHVLCEKPMAMTADDCQLMIDAARKNRVKLMIAYRLHFESANLEVIKLIRSGKIGVPRIFNSTFTRQVMPGDIRLQKKLGGGSMWDLGIYCINAARYVFKSEPTHVSAFSVGGIDPRFREVDEMTSATMHFPHGQLANFTSSFGASGTSFYEVIGTKGVIRVEPAYDYSIPLSYQVTINEKKKVFKTSKHDQFAAELVYFSNCILENKEPEPSGEEGRIDSIIINAIYEAARTKTVVKLPSLHDPHPILPHQKILLPPHSKPNLSHATEMSR